MGNIYYDTAVSGIRLRIGDLASPYTYSDDILGEYLKRSVSIINQKLGWTNTVASGTFSGQPTDFELEIYSLQASCIIKSSEATKASAKSLLIKDGDTTIDMSSMAGGVYKTVNSMQAELDSLIKHYLLGRPGYMVY